MTDSVALLRQTLPAVLPRLRRFARALTRNVRAARWYSLSAGALFALLVFSYFYLWTAAAAWLVIPPAQQKLAARTPGGHRL